MKQTKIIVYLLGLLSVISLLVIIDFSCGILSTWGVKAGVYCVFTGMMAGILYCLRGLYVNYCTGQWDDMWILWYYLRPITSAISGLASYIFLQAGLLTLGNTVPAEAPIYGFLALAFVAGYNVDNFLKKLESISNEIWGIKSTRSSSRAEEQKNEESEKA